MIVRPFVHPSAPLHRGPSPLRRVACALGLLACSLPGAAHAQTEQELATRRILIERATAERVAGHHAQALELAQRAGALQMTPSVRLFIAQEFNANGDPARAFGAAAQCLRELEGDRSVRRRRELMAACQAVQSSARGRIAYLVVRTDGAAPEGLRVTVQSDPLNAALLGVPSVVSPGELAIEASAPGRRPFAARRGVAAGETVEVVLALPVEAPMVTEPPPPVEPPSPLVVAPREVLPVVVAPPSVVVPPRREPAPEPPSRLGPGLLLGAGGAALIGSAVLFGLRVRSLEGCTLQDRAAVCETPAQLENAHSANGLAVGSGVLLGAGVVSAGVGVAWLLLRGAERARSDRATPSLVYAPGAVAFGVFARMP